MLSSSESMRFGSGRSPRAWRQRAPTLTVPGQPTYTLEPTAENKFTLKGQSGFRVEFTMADGTPTQMVLHQPNGTFTAERK